MTATGARHGTGGVSGAQVATLSAALIAAREQGDTLLPPSRAIADFDLSAGYAVGRACHDALVRQGLCPTGRKVGFTNPATWREFGLDTPVWAHVYDRTVHEAGDTAPALAVGRLVAPRIEPEIVVRLGACPPPDAASDEAIAGCIDALAIGFEFVDCHYPDWRFTAADAVADFGVHAALVIGPWRRLAAGEAAALVAALPASGVELARDGRPVASGTGSNALGSPLNVLRHLRRILASQPEAAPLQAGEIVSTGTLTPLPFVFPGETWSVRSTGLDLAPLAVSLTR